MIQQLVRRVTRLLATILIIAGPSRVWAQVFTPNNLVVSRSVYAGGPSSTCPQCIQPTQTLPPGCVPGTVKLPILGSTNTISVKVACATASNDGTYPTVFNNALVDPSFGETAPIYLDQITGFGALINTLTIPSGDIVTSFESKSELAVNLAADGQSITFVGYVGGPGFTTGPNQYDVSESNTPGVVDPTNPVPSQYYRSVAEVDAFGNIQITNGNAYSGNNGRAAIKGPNGYYYTAGNDNNGGLSKTQLPETQVGVNLITSTGAELLVPGETTVPPNIDMLGYFLFDSDKPGKDTNFRGITIFNNTLYVSKGSGGNGLNSVYQVGTQGTLPTPATNTTTQQDLLEGGNLGLSVTPLPGFPQYSSTNTAANTAQFPFGMFFANSNTLYVTDEGNLNIGTVSSSNAYADALPQNNPTAGLQKWIFNETTGQWALAYTLTAGLNLGVPYTPAASSVNGPYPTGINTANTTALFPGGLPWLPATDGLRNLTGRVNTDGTVNLWAITSTVSGEGDDAADPNQLVTITDNLAATSLPSTESFTVLEPAVSGQVLRGVSFAPGVTGSCPSSPTTCNGVYNGTCQENLMVSARQNCAFVGGAIEGNVQLNGGSLQLTNAVVTGNVQLQGGGTFSIGPSATIDGNLQIQNIPAGSAQNQVCDTQIGGNLQFQNNGTAVDIGSGLSSCPGNSIGGNLQLQNNSAAVTAIGNSVTGNLQVSNNTADTTIDNNTVNGNLQDNNNSAPTAVFDNTVGKNLQCQNNTSITGGGNTASQKQGQCSSF